MATDGSAGVAVPTSAVVYSGSALHGHFKNLEISAASLFRDADSAQSGHHACPNGELSMWWTGMGKGVRRIGSILNQVRALYLASVEMPVWISWAC